MSDTAIKGISTYQMHVQSLSTRANELSKSGDASSLSLASALRQQMSSVQGQLSAVKASNENAQIYSYNAKAEANMSGTVGSKFDMTV
ncbi:MAG: hypothetical protein K6G87_10975 [Butyrivibrio sp.]|uniref:hypothetical protein n=1 Tax=Butyrivibrio sp. TaxID=28121 RepID=UPI0025FE2E37|nr:hypothetical protein [Butyrivibrio sp.]MCR5771734.1 hypothetical protein [Butyrivibrio sp.]